MSVTSFCSCMHRYSYLRICNLTDPSRAYLVLSTFCLCVLGYTRFFDSLGVTYQVWRYFYLLLWEWPLFRTEMGSSRPRDNVCNDLYPFHCFVFCGWSYARLSSIWDQLGWNIRGGSRPRGVSQEGERPEWSSSFQPIVDPVLNLFPAIRKFVWSWVWSFSASPIVIASHPFRSKKKNLEFFFNVGEGG